MNDLEFPDEPEYVPKLVDLHLGAAEVKPIKKHIEPKKQKNSIVTLLDIIVVLLGVGNIWLFVSVWKWILT